MLPGQVLPWQLESVQDGPSNLILKFGQNQVSNNRDIPYMDKYRQDKCCLNKCRHDCWNRSRWSQESTFKVWSKSGRQQLRYSGHGQMSSWQMLPGQMSQWQLKSVQDGPRDLTLKFCQNRVSNSWDIANIEFVSWWVVGGVQSNFHVKPKLRLGWVEVGLGWGFDNYGDYGDFYLGFYTFNLANLQV